MQFDINFEHDEVYERGASLLAVMVSAKAVDDAKSFDFYCSLCGKALWLKHLMSPDDCTPITVKPQYVFRHPDAIDRGVSYVVKRLGERMVAGRMAIPFFQRAELERLPSLPKEIRRLSVNEMAEFVLDDARQAEAGNVKKRIWARSRPVIHLAAAAATVGQQLRMSEYLIALESFLFNRWLIEAIVNRAEQLEALIAKDPKFPVKAEQLIRVRLG